MKQYLLTLLLATACMPAIAQTDSSPEPALGRHHPGLNLVYIPQYTNGSKKTLQYNRLGGDISYRFCILPMLRVGAFFESTAPNKVDNTVYTINEIYGFTLDFPIWIQNKVAIAPGIMNNIRIPSGSKDNNFGSPMTGGVYLNIMVRMTNTIALSAEAGTRKMPVYGYRQYPTRIGMKILL